ncbi:uncharacterized protein LOC130793920 [Actinidia eriantha]|uniref:uncharacterized protein LOC130793920 n=1 Tax=Actinidia eriantha TaxID=165200 RepID=UPI0025852CF7|nr:uncharacterized protein LOC130793920 [Actinidia eriantha]
MPAKKTRRGFAYHCPTCEVSLCINCILLVPFDDYDDYRQIRLQKHEHPFILCAKDKKFDISCIDCKHPIEDESLYLCPLCFLFYHESCADPPSQINHLFHSQHPLTLLYHPPPPDFEVFSFRCKACGLYGSGRSYNCTKFNFDIHVPCSQHVPTVKSDIHKHPLAFFNLYFDIKLRCHICDGSMNGPFFRCVECDYSVHLHYFPALPSSVKHTSHRHSLTITDSPIKDYSDEDDDAEFYCDACEKRRNLNDCSYYCAEPGCRSVAHIHCLITEIMCFLEEELSNISQVVKEQQYEEVISSVVEESSLVTSESNRIEVPGNLNIAELDDEIEKLRVEIEALAAKLGAFERSRAHLASSTI